MPRDLHFSTIPAAEKVATIASWLEEKKAEDILGLDLKGANAFTDAVLVASATSGRHAQGLADFVLAQCKAASFEFLHLEGYQSAQWILLDLNDVVVCIFQRDSRDLYRIEELWTEASILHDTRRPAGR